MKSPVSKNLICSIVILVVSCAATIPATAEVIQGVGIVCHGWNFSTQMCHDECMLQANEGCDMSITYVVIPPLGLRVGTWNFATIAMLEDVTFEELEEAPSDETLYIYDHPARLDVTYVVHTTEGHFAKFKFIFLSTYLFSQIEYVYQSDGSRSFVPSVPVERSTWGAVKALYTIR